MARADGTVDDSHSEVANEERMPEDGHSEADEAADRRNEREGVGLGMTMNHCRCTAGTAWEEVQSPLRCRMVFSMGQHEHCSGRLADADETSEEEADRDSSQSVFAGEDLETVEELLGPHCLMVHQEHQSRTGPAADSYEEDHQAQGSQYRVEYEKVNPSEMNESLDSARYSDPILLIQLAPLSRSSFQCSTDSFLSIPLDSTIPEYASKHCCSSCETSLSDSSYTEGVSSVASCRLLVQHFFSSCKEGYQVQAQVSTTSWSRSRFHSLTFFTLALAVRPGELDEHARIFDPDARKGTAAEATSEGGDFAKSRPVDTRESGLASRQGPPGTTVGKQGTASATSTPAPSTNAGSSVDPGYFEGPSASSSTSSQVPSDASDPFPLPFSKGVDLASPSQSDSLPDLGAPARVPGREPGQESREQRIRRLIYQTRKRGILETDLLMSTFAMKELWEMPEKEIEEFDRLLDEPDWDLYYWMTDRKPVPDRWRESFDQEGRLGYRLRRHTKNEEKEVRFMPDAMPEQAGKQ